MFQSSVFIELMICAIYGPKCKHAKKLFEKGGAIANRKSVDFSADALEQRLTRLGVTQDR